MKCTRAQLYFRNLLRDCAKEARIWEKAYTLPAIPDGKLHKFFELITTAAPQLASHKTEVKARLGQALQDKRKYVNDVKAGKRKGRSGKGDTKDDETFQKCLDGYLVSNHDESNEVAIKPNDQRLTFKHGDEVFVFKTVDKKRKLAKAIYLGPKDQNDSEEMYSLLQVSTIYELAEEIPLPETTFEGATILNNLEVQTRSPRTPSSLVLHLAPGQFITF